MRLTWVQAPAFTVQRQVGEPGTSELRSSNHRLPGLAIDSNGYAYVGTFGTGVYTGVRTFLHLSLVNRIHFPTLRTWGRISRIRSIHFMTIRFTIPHTEQVTLIVHDLLGQKVATLISDELPAGVHSLRWRAKNAASGVYLYHIQAGRFSETKKLILMR